MPAPRLITALAALLVLALGASCSERANEPVAAETDDPFFVQGQQLKRQGRNPEALTAFLKVIEKRGERAAAESHLEAGQIYLNHTKDPVEAYHHFRKYLELQPNSKEAELVRGMVKASLREFAARLPGRPMDDQAVRLQADDEILKLRRENEELRAELAVLRGGGATPVNRAPRMINVPPGVAPSSLVPTAAAANSPVTRAPIQPAPPPNPVVQPAPLPKQAAPTGVARGGTPVRTAPAATGRTHTVVAKDTLFNLSKRYGVKVEDLAAANGLPSVSAPIKLGAVLKIPGPTSGR